MRRFGHGEAEARAMMVEDRGVDRETALARHDPVWKVDQRLGLEAKRSLEPEAARPAPAGLEHLGHVEGKIGFVAVDEVPFVGLQLVPDPVEESRRPHHPDPLVTADA
jgi:hypothetical protein